MVEREDEGFMSIFEKTGLLFDIELGSGGNSCVGNSCVGGHIWTYAGDPDYFPYEGMPCDCGATKWEEHIDTIRPERFNTSKMKSGQGDFIYASGYNDAVDDMTEPTPILKNVKKVRFEMKDDTTAFWVGFAFVTAVIIFVLYLII